MHATPMTWEKTRAGGKLVVALISAIALGIGTAGHAQTPPQTTEPRASLGSPLEQIPVAPDPSGPPSQVSSQQSTNAPLPSEASTHPAGEWPAQEKIIKPVFELQGRIQAEAALVSQSARDQAILGTIHDGVGFRRARLGAHGDVGEQVHWIAEFDFAGGNISLEDVFVAVDKLPLVGELRVGNFRERFSLEGQTSSNYFPFIERSPSNTIDPARHWGVGLFDYTANERLTFQAGIFRSGSNSTGDDISNSNDLQYTARVTGLPWYAAGPAGPNLLHLGAAFSQQFAKNDTISYNQGPQSTLLQSSDTSGSPFVQTITVKATQQQLYNVQSALVLGPLAFQAEWEAARLAQIAGGPVLFHGGYVFATYFLTGEHRDYLPKQGAFGGVQVRSPFLCMQGWKLHGGGPGAWELTARFAYMNYSSPNLPPAANGLRVGGREAEVTAGLNWYLNDSTRLMFNYIHVVPVDPNFGPSFADAFFLSTQIFW
jgi:phosphate-selective porin OprO/OprP